MMSFGPIELLLIVVAAGLLAGLGAGVWILIRRITGAGDEEQ